MNKDVAVHCKICSLKTYAAPLRPQSILNETINRQLLHEVEHDIMNYQNRGVCYLPKLKAEADNPDTRF